MSKPDPVRVASDAVRLVHPSDVKKGDRFVDPARRYQVVWQALDNAKSSHREVHIPVQYALDGGTETRIWDKRSSFKLTIA